ncbi:MAG TPA: hypothetical protein VGK19_18145 [Capsulimonadaceae bacterium]|jgi:hypothetical protein
MAWQISITNEGWGDIRRALETWSVTRLAEALGDYNYEVFHGSFGRRADVHHKGAWSAKKLARLPHDVLVDACFAAVEDVDTCDNGGYLYWVDPEGYHKVEISDADKDYD